MSAHGTSRTGVTHPTISPPPGARSIEVHLRELDQLFDTLDRSPFRERDLDPKAEEYIVESIREFPSSAPCAIVFYLDQPPSVPDEEKVIGDAIHAHFARRARVLRGELRRLLRRGLISLLIGLTVLVTFFIIGQVIRQILGETHGAALLRESLLIGGWVAMWKPLEIFLYDWWPIVGNRKLNERLAKIDVQVIHPASKPAAPRPDNSGQTRMTMR